VGPHPKPGPDDIEDDEEDKIPKPYKASHVSSCHSVYQGFLLFFVFSDFLIFFSSHLPLNFSDEDNALGPSRKKSCLMCYIAPSDELVCFSLLFFYPY